MTYLDWIIVILLIIFALGIFLPVDKGSDG